MTTRKHFATLVAGVFAFGLGGCATPGPLHVYLVEEGGTRNIVDFADHAGQEGPSFLEDGERAIGFAYDPYTDHFFLRLAPGNRIRVIDRPARAIKREFTIEGLAAAGAGDMAVRPRDGHLFLLHDDGRAIAEITRLGKRVRTFPLAELGTPAVALALDPLTHRLFILHQDGRRITSHDFEGRRLGELTLEQRVGTSLAFDPAKDEFYTTSADGLASFLIFTSQGQLRAAWPLPLPTAFVDVGPRSFVRVF